MSVNVTSKPLSDTDGEQVLRAIYNDNDKTIATSGFVSGKKGHRIETKQISATVDEYRYLDIVFETTATLNSSTTVTMVNTYELMVGQYVSLPIGTSGISLDTTIASIDSLTQITLSQTATATGSFTFRAANLLRKELIEYDDAGHDNLLVSERTE